MFDLLWVLNLLISFPTSSTRISSAVKQLSTTHYNSLARAPMPPYHERMSRMQDHISRLESKSSSSMCFVDQNPSTPNIDTIGQVFKRELPGTGRHIEISQYDIQTRATLQNKLQFLSNGKWNTIWNAIDFGESPFLPMHFPTQEEPGTWRWELTCVANCHDAKIHSLSTDYCFHNHTIDRHDHKIYSASDDRPASTSLIGGSSIVGCYHKQVPYAIAMNHVGAEHILPLDGEGRHIRVIRYDLSVNSTIEHKLQFWNDGWKTLWSNTAFGDAPAPPSYIPKQNQAGAWRWTLTCVSQCHGVLTNFKTDYCLQPAPGKSQQILITPDA